MEYLIKEQQVKEYLMIKPYKCSIFVNGDKGDNYLLKNHYKLGRFHLSFFVSELSWSSIFPKRVVKTFSSFSDAWDYGNYTYFDGKGRFESYEESRDA